MPRARTLLPVLLGAIALIIAGCASSGYGTSGGAKSGGGNASGATVAFATPASGAKVTSPVKVSFNVQGAKIGKPETGDMHLHVYVDQSSNYKILYATSGQVDVPAGQHTLKVVLAQPNHTETSTTATEQVDVTGTGGAQAPTTTTTSGGYGYP
jgi:hypothetical protein